MNHKDLAILNSLVTFAAEKIPRELSEDERKVAKMVDEWALRGEKHYLIDMLPVQAIRTNDGAFHERDSVLFIEANIEDFPSLMKFGDHLHAAALLDDAETGPPGCPHCGALAPYGDERIQWLHGHIDSRTHRLWWGLKKHIYSWYGGC